MTPSKIHPLRAGNAFDFWFQAHFVQGEIDESLRGLLGGIKCTDI